MEKTQDKQKNYIVNSEGGKCCGETQKQEKGLRRAVIFQEIFTGNALGAKI